MSNELPKKFADMLARRELLLRKGPLLIRIPTRNILVKDSLGKYISFLFVGILPPKKTPSKTLPEEVVIGIAEYSREEERIPESTIRIIRLKTREDLSQAVSFFDRAFVFLRSMDTKWDLENHQ